MLFRSLPAGPRDGHLWPSIAQECLLEAALGPPTSAEAGFVQWTAVIDVEQPFDWQMQRLLPMTYVNLQAAGVQHPLLARLRGVYKRAWVESHQLRDRVRPAVSALLAEGIPVLLLKGAALSCGYYPNPVMRPMSDLDLAVPLTEVRRAITALRAAGWQNTSPADDERVQWAHALQFVHPDGGELDLHWRIMIEADASVTDSLWMRTESARFGDVTVQVLDPTCALLHTLVHAMRWNEASPFRWVVDAHQILRHRARDVDWERLVALALRMRVTYRVRLALAYLAERWTLQVPRSVMEQLAQEVPAWRERAEACVILADQSEWHRSARRFYWTLFGDWVRMVPLEWSPITVVWRFPHYLRYRLGLDGRRELLRLAWRGLLSRTGLRARRGDSRSASSTTPESLVAGS